MAIHLEASARRFYYPLMAAPNIALQNEAIADLTDTESPTLWVTPDEAQSLDGESRCAKLSLSALSLGLSFLRKAYIHQE